MSTTNFAAGQLRSYIDRILRLKSENDAINSDVKEVYAELKSDGFDKTTVGLVVARLRKELKNGASETEEQDSLLQLYMDAYRGPETRDNGSVVVGVVPARKSRPAPVQAPAKGHPEKEALHAGAHTREELKATATRFRMEDHANMSAQLAVIGLISEEAATENAAIAQAINNKWGDGKQLQTNPAPVVSSTGSGAADGAAIAPPSAASIQPGKDQGEGGLSPLNKETDDARAAPAVEQSASYTAQSSDPATNSTEPEPEDIGAIPAFMDRRATRNQPMKGLNNG